MNLAPPQNQLAPAPNQLEELGQFLRQSLQQRSPWLQLQVQCAVKQSTLLVLIEHLLHIEPDPKLTFLDLEEALFDRAEELLQSGFTKSIVGDSQSLPVRAYLRISGYQQPYATDSFLVEPEPAEAEANGTLAEFADPVLLELSTSSELAAPALALDAEPAEQIAGEAPEPIAPVPTQPTALEEPVVSEPIAASLFAEPESGTEGADLELAIESEPAVEEQAIESLELDPIAVDSTPLKTEAVELASPLSVPEPEVIEPEIAEPEIAELEITSAAIAEPEVAEPEIAEPEIAEPEITSAAIAELEIAEPEIAEPEIAELEITSAAIAEPEIVESEVAEPGSVESYTAPELEIPVEQLPPVQPLGELTLSEIEAALLELEASPSELTESSSSEAIEPAIGTYALIESPWVEPSPTVSSLEPSETESEPIAANYLGESDADFEPIAEILPAEVSGSATIASLSEPVEPAEAEPEPVAETYPTQLDAALPEVERLEPTLTPSVESLASELDEIEPDAITNSSAEPHQTNLLEPALENPFALLDETESITDVSPIEPDEAEPVDLPVGLSTARALRLLSELKKIDLKSVASPVDTEPATPEAIAGSPLIESDSPVDSDLSDSAVPEALAPETPAATNQPSIELPDSYLADLTDLPANQAGAIDVSSVSVPVSEPDLPQAAQPPAVIPPATAPAATESPTEIVHVSELPPLARERTVIPVEPLVQSPPRSRWSASSAMLTGSVGLFALVSSAYALTRPCVLGSTCEPLQKAQQLDQQASRTIASTDSALKVAEAYDQLNQARHLLDTIPAWSGQYQAAQALRSTYSLKADVVERVVRALKQANLAALRSQNPPHPLQDWRKIQLTWREAIALLEKVPPDSPVAELAQKKLKEYQANLSQTDARVITEQDAQDKVSTARNTAQVAETRAGLASSPESWQQVYLTWEAAVALLLRIPEGTMAQVEAKQLIPTYQAKMATANQRRLQEVSSTGSLQEAISSADQARSAEQKSQWKQAIEAWQRALNTVQKIPQGTSYYLQAQALVGEYQSALARAKESQRRLSAMQELKPDLDRTCGGTLRVCTYTFSPEAVRVQVTAEYDQLVESHINNSQLRGNYSARTEVVNQVNHLLQELSRLSETARVPIELYNSNGSKFGTYTPNPSGGASSITGVQ
jgi:hypothetical protein